MKWGSPDALVWLWLLVPAAWSVFILARRKERRLSRLISSALWPSVVAGLNPRRGRIRLALWCLAIGFMGLAFARPQWGFRWEEVRQRGLDIMVVLDTSRSMLAEDIKPNRLQQAKWGIRDLVRKLQGDRVGLVSFAGTSFLQCPLTIDYAAFLMTLEDVEVGIIPRGGTDIRQALENALQSFEHSGDADRAIVLITDGEDHGGRSGELIDEIKRRGIRVFAIGVGTLEGDLIPEPSGNGPSAFYKNRKGEVVKTALHEDALARLALATDGTYVRSAPGDFGLERVYEQGISKLRKSEEDSRMFKVYEERFVWPLAAAFLLLLADALAGRWRRVRAVEPTRRAAVAVLLLGLATVAQAADPRTLLKQGNRLYEDGRLAEAEAPYQQAAELAAESKLDASPAYYNLGNTLYRQGKWAAALDAYGQALRSTDVALQARCRFNRARVLTAMAESAIQEKNGPQALSFFAQAIEAYEAAVLLDPVDLDAKRNLEIALQRRDGLIRLVDKARRTLQQATEMAVQRRYEETVALLQGEAEDLAPAFVIDQELGKQYQAVLSNTQTILRILQAEPQVQPGSERSGSGDA